MQVEIYEVSDVNVDIDSQEPAQVIVLEGTPGEQGPKGDPGEGVLVGPLAERPAPQAGWIYITTDTNETYIASGTEEE